MAGSCEALDADAIAHSEYVAVFHEVGQGWYSV